MVLIPFIAGQWSLPQLLKKIQKCRFDVLIPFIAGQWSLHPSLQGIRLSLAWS